MLEVAARGDPRRTDLGRHLAGGQGGGRVAQHPRYLVERLGAHPLGQRARRRAGPQGSEHLVDLVLQHLAGSARKLLAIDGVLL
jgi:hypothetical protein